MSMTLKDFEQLKKFMNMTESGADAEVVMAVRKANALLLKYSYNWDAVFKRLVTLEVEEAQPERATAPPPRSQGARPAPVPATVDPVRVNRLFEQALENVHPNSPFRATVEDIHSKWEKYGSLSVGQLSVIEKAAAKRDR